jgi:outer membrane protein assembly factor BamB
VVAGPRLFTLGINGTISAFDTASGRVLWRKQFGEFDATSPDYGAAMSPAVSGDLLIVHVGGNRSGALTALSTATGQPKWQWKGDAPAYSSPVVATIAGVPQVITQTRSNVVGVRLSDGTLLWRIPFEVEFQQNIVTPLVIGDVLVYSGYEKPLTAVRLSQQGGTWTTTPVWKNESVPLYMNSPVAAGDLIVGFTHRNRGQFFGVDAKTGATLWQSAGRDGDNAAIVAAGNWMLAATPNGELLVGRVDRTKFDLMKRYELARSPIWAHPCPAGAGVLIKDAETLTYWTF